MLAIGLVLLVLVLVYASSRVASGDRGDARPAPHGDRLASWVAAGLLTEEQAAAIRAHEAAPVAASAGRPETDAGRRTWRIPSVAEPLGYLGGTLAVIGLLLVVSRFWPDMSTASRLALSGAATLACLWGGALLHEPAEAALVRFRWALWLAATAAAGLFGGIVADGVGADAPESVVLAVSGSVALISGALWRGRYRPVQQATALAGGLIAVGAAAAHLDPDIGAGAAVVVAGAVVLHAGVRRLTSAPPLSAALGAVAVAVGTQVLAIERPALQLLGVAAALTLLSLPSLPQLQPQLEHRIAGMVGILLLITAVPGSLGHFAQEAALATGTAVWLVGGALLALGVRDLVERRALVEVVGGVTMLGGAALIGVESTAFAPVLGIATAVGLLALGAASEKLRHSVLGTLGLLVHVPWAIGRFFPGEGRVPLLLLVTGVLVLGLAVLLARRGGRTPNPPLSGGPLTPKVP